MIKRHLCAGTVLLLAACPAAAVPTNAEDAVRSIYRRLPEADFDYRKVRYAPALKHLLRRADDEARGGDQVINAVPFCDCQDTADDYSFTVASHIVSADRAEVTVRLRNGAASTYRIEMVRLRDGWAVADVHGPEHSSLVAWLHTALAER